jgi:hypothetical protein
MQQRLLHADKQTLRFLLPRAILRGQPDEQVRALPLRLRSLQQHWDMPHLRRWGNTDQREEVRAVSGFLLGSVAEEKAVGNRRRLLGADLPRQLR